MHKDIILSHKNWTALSQEVNIFLQKETWRSIYGGELIKLIIKMAFFAGSFWIFAQSGLVFKIIGMILIASFYYSITITGTHEAGHNSFVKSTKSNQRWGYFFSDFWSGQSSLWWHHRHVQVHHVYTNILDVEPNLFFYPQLNRYLYFFVIPYLLIFWMIGNSVKYLWRKWDKLSVYICLLFTGYFSHIYLFLNFVSLPWAIFCTFLMRTLYAPLFLHVAIFNHIGLEFPKTRPPWLPHQTRTTRNLKSNWFLRFIGGNAFIQCHIEHHLFPTMPNSMLKKIRPIVFKYLKKEGYKYVEESYWYCLKNCIKYYKNLFENF